VSFAAMLFASQIFSKISRPRFAYVLALSLLCVPTLPAQITFLGAQQTVPATGLSGPNGAAMDRSGNVFIADTGNNRVVKLDPHGNQTVVSVSPLTLSFPLAIAFDGSGNMYVTDNGNNRVVKVPAGGGAATSFASVLTPDGLAVDANGNVFVADNEDGMIVKITSGGVTSNFETDLLDPVDVAVDAAGNVYLADGLLSTISKFLPTGGSGTNLGSSLTNVGGVAVDRAGNVYVAENSGSAAIVEISALGVQTTLATTGLAAATYLTVDSNYDLFIPDNSNSQVIEFSTVSVPMGFANVCQGGVPAPCAQFANLQFEIGEDSVSNLNVTTTGDPELDFGAGDGTTCSGSTSPCVVQVVFAPTQPGMRSGALMITDGNAGQITSVQVYGTGSAAEIGFTLPLTSPPFGNDGFQDPTAIAVSGAGVFGETLNAFIADDEACVIWITTEENFQIYAGTYGSCGYAGDGGAATSATLGHPEDVTLDGAGNLYIADTSNGVVRKVDRNGIITTVAGNSELSPGFSGDGGPATSAALAFPDGIALDTAGNLYIADTNNNRIRKVDLAGIITTVAGSNQAGYSGDAGPATSAKLSQPFGVRADAAGNLFIADSNNNVIRKVDLTGKITTVAGNFALGAGYTGDGGPATGAQLGFPIFVSLDAAGELFISDDDNNVVRRVDGSGNISTFVVPTPFPVDFVIDPAGSVAMIDPQAEAMTLMVRTIPNGYDFGSTNINTPTVAQDVTITDIGNQPLTISAITPPTGFNLGGSDTSCSTSSPLNIGIDCILGIVFDPPTAGGYETAVALTDNSVGAYSLGSQNIPVSGTGVQPVSPSATALSAAPTTATAGQSVTLTATVTPTPTGTFGSVDFCIGATTPVVVRSAPQTTRAKSRSLRQWTSGALAIPENTSCGAGTLLGTVSVGSNGVAMLALTNLPVGTDIITANYSGNTTLDISTSDPVTVTITAATATTTTLTISPTPGYVGQSITLTGTAAPVPSTAPLGTITFCDSGSVGPTLRRHTNLVGTKSRHVFRPSSQPEGQPTPCGADTALGTVNINAQGVASLSLTTLVLGDHNIYAVYSGAAGFQGSSSDPIDESVNSAYTVTAPQTPYTVGQGGTVTVNVTVPPLGCSFDNVVTMSATGLPAGATTTFNPPTVTPGVEGAPTVMTIQLLSVTTASIPTVPQRRIPFGPLNATLALCCVVFLYRQATRTFIRRSLIFASLLIVATLLSACNGGFAGKPGTIPGNYIVTITGTSGSLHPSTTVTITVQ
jgi:sugar lactone lactonase YvrE